MHRITLVVLFAATMTATVTAQQPRRVKDDPFGPEISPGDVKPTPEMWFYQQDLRLWQDPKVAVRRKAEFRAQQRMQRIASQRWFGINNLRPMAAPVPFMSSSYSPYWASNSRDPYRWMAFGRPIVVVRRPPQPAPGFYGLW